MFVTRDSALNLIRVFEILVTVFFRKFWYDLVRTPLCVRVERSPRAGGAPRARPCGSAHGALLFRAWRHELQSHGRRRVRAEWTSRNDARKRLQKFAADDETVAYLPSAFPSAALY